MSAADDVKDPTKFGFHDGQKVREYPKSSGGRIYGYTHLCDACSYEHPSGQASRHNTPPGTQCQSKNHESNVILENSGAQDATEFEKYHDHPDVRGWAKDDYSGRGKDKTMCTSCAEDLRSSGKPLSDDWYPVTDRHLQPYVNPRTQEVSPAPFTNCDTCGHDLTQGRKEASMQRQAYGETKAPTQVDTLRDDTCPVCGDTDSFDGDTCQVCGYVAPPSMFRDPDLQKAKLLDLRQDPASGMANDVNPNVGQNLPPVDPSQVDAEGAVEGEEAGTLPEEEDGIVEGEVRNLESGAGEDGPVDPDAVDEDGEVEGGPEDPEAADKHFQQGGEPFTPGPNAPQPGEPMAPEELAEDGQEILPEEGVPGEPGNPGDGVPDLLCPACGFEGDGAHPTSTPGDLTAPANVGDGMLEGDVCPNCQQATLMGVGEIAQLQQMQQQGGVQAV